MGSLILGTLNRGARLGAPETGPETPHMKAIWGFHMQDGQRKAGPPRKSGPAIWCKQKSLIKQHISRPAERLPVVHKY